MTHVTLHLWRLWSLNVYSPQLPHPFFFFLIAASISHAFFVLISLFFSFSLSDCPFSQCLSCVCVCPPFCTITLTPSLLVGNGDACAASSPENRLDPVETPNFKLEESVARGILFKRGGLFGKSWQQRYCVLNMDVGILTYFKLDSKTVGPPLVAPVVELGNSLSHSLSPTQTHTHTHTHIYRHTHTLTHTRPHTHM